MEDLSKIGFYTLSDKRAKETSIASKLQRCELILTNKCNFKCPYCRGNDATDLSLESALDIVSQWTKHDLQNIRFSGGEPTLWRDLAGLVYVCKESKIKRIAISTNGSADFELYEKLVELGANDFSISLDACCASTGDIMAGRRGIWEKVIDNIKRISKIAYTTVGVVLTPENIGEIDGIIRFAYSLGVADIRIIPSAQWNSSIYPTVASEILDTNPILKYRVANIKNGRHIRGISPTDSCKCPLVLDDMAVMNGKHYPCIIYLREKGKAIGNFSNINDVRIDRYTWFYEHNTHDDPICKNNCLDVCVDYNNKVREFKHDSEI
ncbi:MAG: radical SAM protein [Candidatus Paceibacterota bacterium]|jgi:molybdenum cofactor biosynthesis enzyme MoaA